VQWRRAICIACAPALKTDIASGSAFRIWRDFSSRAFFFGGQSGGFVLLMYSCCKCIGFASAAQNCVGEAGLMPWRNAAHADGVLIYYQKLCARLSPLALPGAAADAQAKRLAGKY